MRRKAKTMVAPLQQAEFDSLPYSVQRKYFSSLERLKIRQQSLDQYASGCSSRASSSTQRRPSLTLTSQAEVDFFLSLPDKVRKLYYSREEQTHLLGKCEQAFLPADTDFERARQRFSDFQFGFPKDVNDTVPRGRSRRRSSSTSPSARSTQRSLTLYMQEKEEDADGSIFYHDTMSASRSKKLPPPVRRTMSLTGPASRYFGTTSAVLMADTPLFTTSPAQMHQRAHSSSLSGRRSSHTPSPPVFDPEATYYQDPAARRKLRTYLASPQKFDEAIEFGFPSATSNDTVTPHYQLPAITSHSRKFSRDMHTFIRDGKLSFFEDSSSDNQGLESDQGSVADLESPTTPSSTGLSFRLHTRRLSHRKLSTEDSPALSPHLNREMTLRMTLTRPDLRADDDQLYGWQCPSPRAPTRNDPLTLEDLVLTDDMSGTNGAFYVKPKARGNLVSRMLKRTSFKGR